MTDVMTDVALTCHWCSKPAVCHVRLDDDRPLCDEHAREAILALIPRLHGWGGAGWRPDGTRHSDDAIRAHCGANAIGGCTSSPTAMMPGVDRWAHVAIARVCPSGGPHGQGEGRDPGRPGRRAGAGRDPRSGVKCYALE